MFCWHNWEVWKTEYFSTAGYLLVAIMGICSVALLLCSWATNDIVPYYIGIFNTVFTFCAFVIHAESGEILPYKDKTCIKCGKHVFDATLVEKRVAEKEARGKEERAKENGKKRALRYKMEQEFIKHKGVIEKYM